MSDPTAYNLHGGLETDPQVRRIHAYTNHGRHFVNVPFITKVADNLWQGGVEVGLVLPEFITAKLSLYPWEEYVITHDVDLLSVEMYDSVKQGLDQVLALAEWVNDRRKEGPVLVHCQAGLNRSSVVIAQALILSGEVANGQEAIDRIRNQRDTACLCNPAFERWVLDL